MDETKKNNHPEWDNQHQEDKYGYIFAYKLDVK